MQVVFTEQSGPEIVDVSVDKIPKLRNFVKNLKFEDDLWLILKNKNYAPEAFKHSGYEIVLNAFITSDPANVDQFINYSKSEQLSLFDNVNGNIIEIARRAGLADIFINKLLNLTAIDSKGNYIGPGEILFALLFNDVKNDTSTGDLMYNNVPLEVKCRGGRFGDRPSAGNRIPIDIFVRGIVSKEQIADYETRYSDVKDVCSHIRYGFDLCEDKYAFYTNVIKILNEIYGRGNHIASKFITIEDLKSSKLANKIAKVYIYGKILSKNISHIIFINKDYNYMLVERYDILKDGGLVDDRTIVVEQFKFNDLYPQVFINTISETF